MDRSERIALSILQDATPMYISIFDVTSTLLVEFGVSSPDEQLRESLAALRVILGREFATIGQIVGEGHSPKYKYSKVTFVPWSLPVDLAIDRVEREWKSLGRNPTAGDIFWLEVTPEGERFVEQNEVL